MPYFDYIYTFLFAQYAKTTLFRSSERLFKRGGVRNDQNVKIRRSCQLANEYRGVMRKDHLTGLSSEHIGRKKTVFAGVVRLSSSLIALLSPAQKQISEKYDLNIQII